MKVTALIPAYNEEKTIGSIVKTLRGITSIDEVVVVNDGSSDNTNIVASQAGARVINLPYNQGKGAALQKGIDEIDTDIFLMLDADLIGFNQQHVCQLLDPIINGSVDMTIGTFNNGRGITDLAQFFTPNLSGQRAIRSEILQEMINLKKSGYGVEIALNKYVKKRGKVKYVDLPELTHLLKEEKRGFAQGVKDRAKMYWDILKVIFKLDIKE